MPVKDLSPSIYMMNYLTVSSVLGIIVIINNFLYPTGHRHLFFRQDLKRKSNLMGLGFHKTAKENVEKDLQQSKLLGEK